MDCVDGPSFFVSALSPLLLVCTQTGVFPLHDVMLGHVSSVWCHSIYFAQWELLDIISFLCVLGLFCGFNLLKIWLVYHVCMVEVYELEDFLGSCVHNLETYVTLGSPRTVGRWSIPSMAWFFLGLVTPVCSWLCGPTDTFHLCSLNPGSNQLHSRYDQEV